MKKWLIIIVLIFAAIFAGLYYLRNGNNEQVTPTIAVKKGAITEKAEAIGYIRPGHFITIKSQVGGTVAKISHDAGEYIKKGENLLIVKPAPAPADYAVAFQALAEAKTNEANALKDLRRYQQALKQKLITKNYTDYINAQKTYQASKSQRQLATQKLALLQEGKTQVGGKVIANVVTSPVDGYILYRNVDIGDPVISLSSAQSATALFTVANMNDLKFQGSVDEMDAAKIHTGMPVTITVGSLSQQKITGTLSKISLQSDQENERTGGAKADTNLPFSVSFQVEVNKLKIPKSVKLRSGYSATANIKIRTASNILILPARVIHFTEDKSYVLLPATNGEKPKKRFITTGLSDGVNVEIKSGLKLGEKVSDTVTAVTQTPRPKRRHMHRRR